MAGFCRTGVYPNAINCHSGPDILTMSDSVVSVADNASALSQSPADNSISVVDADAVTAPSTISDGNGTDSSPEQPYNAIGTNLALSRSRAFQTMV